MVSTTIPAPLIWHPSAFWDGNDGHWNSFVVQVGTPPQDFRVLPSTAGQETWIPVPEGCILTYPPDPAYCGNLRGAQPVKGIPSAGFMTNESTTWNFTGLYALDAQEAELGYGGNGKYGLDTVTWGNLSDSPILKQQVVAGIANPDFWLGVAGLGPKPSNFSNFNAPVTSFLSNLVDKNIIPSLSWAYTAGAFYSGSPASLTLGGYDDNRLRQGISIKMNEDNSRPIQVGVQKILASNTLDGDVNLLPTATYHFIDSTLPHIWLPDDSIDAFVSAFGLIYDNKTDLFLVNDTIHQKLQDLNPSISFMISASIITNVDMVQDIVLPYAALDLQASYPFYSNVTNYFPIRRAANSSQYTIGRTFLQEAYLIADFERNNFTIGQVSSTNLTTPNLVTIHPLANGEHTSSSSLGAGAVGGMVLGIVAFFALLAMLCIFAVVRARRRHAPKDAALVTDTTESTVEPSPSPASELSITPIGETPPISAMSEIGRYSRSRFFENIVSSVEPSPDGSGAARFEMASQPVGHESGLLAEVDGEEHFHEVAGDRPARKGLVYWARGRRRSDDS